MKGWESQTKLDDAGCAPGCSAVDESDSLVVVRPDAVYFYSTDGRGPCFVHDGGCSCGYKTAMGMTTIAGRSCACMHGSQAPTVQAHACHGEHRSPPTAYRLQTCTV